MSEDFDYIDEESISEEKNWMWLWPTVGNADSVEIDDFDLGTNVETRHEPLVREATQNTIDARGDDTHPVYMIFEFGKSGDDLEDGKRYNIELFDSLNKYRTSPNIKLDKIKFSDYRYLKIQDFVKTGGMNEDEIRGFLTKYGHNIGSQKKGKISLGGAGRGRVTIAKASKINTMLLRSVYKNETKPVISGFSMLIPGKKYDGEDRTNSAKLCTNTDPNAPFSFDFNDEFIRDFESRFNIEDEYEGIQRGLTVIIPQPVDEINTENIINCLIENYSVAIFKDVLKPIVDGIPIVPQKFEENYTGDKIQNYISFLEKACKVDGDAREKINIPTGSKSLRIKDIETEEKKSYGNSIQESLDKNGKWFGKVEFTLSKEEKKEKVGFNINIHFDEDSEHSSYLLFRNGMLIPEAFQRRSHKPNAVKGMTIIIDIEDLTLNEYLLLCEGKAHRSFEATQDIKERLRAKGFENIKALDLVTGSARDLIEIIQGAEEKNDYLDLFADIWGITVTKKDKKKRKKKKNIDRDREKVEYIKPKPASCIYKSTEYGLAFYENPDNSDKMESISIGFAYTNDDAHKLDKHSKLDFKLDEDIKIRSSGVKYEVTNEDKNCVLQLTDFDPGWEISLDGFDENREVYHAIIKSERTNEDA